MHDNIWIKRAKFLLQLQSIQKWQHRETMFATLTLTIWNIQNYMLQHQKSQIQNIE